MDFELKTLTRARICNEKCDALIVLIPQDLSSDDDPLSVLSALAIKSGDFETKAGSEKHYKKYIVVNNDKLKFPICVYRLDAQNYSALWLQCSHQGAELQVFGDKLQCPAHGSEFNNKGSVTGGPANANLRRFPVTVENNQLKISLKAV